MKIILQITSNLLRQNLQDYVLEKTKVTLFEQPTVQVQGV